MNCPQRSVNIRVPQLKEIKVPLALCPPSPPPAFSDRWCKSQLKEKTLCRSCASQEEGYWRIVAFAVSSATSCPIWTWTLRRELLWYQCKAFHVCLKRPPHSTRQVERMMIDLYKIPTNVNAAMLGKAVTKVEDCRIWHGQSRQEEAILNTVSESPDIALKTLSLHGF